MTRRIQFLFVFAVILVIANGTLLWNKIFRQTQPQVAKQQQMIEQVLEWESLDSTSLDISEDELLVIVSGIPDGNCPSSESITESTINTLTSEAKRDLFLAITGLLQCYYRASPSALFQYMEDRGEKIDLEKAKSIREAIDADQHSSAEKLEAMTDETLLATFWEWNQCDPHWSSVVEEACSICIWRTNLPEQTDSITLGRLNKNLFENETNYSHLFRPDKNIADIAKSQAILLADVLIVIEHDESRGLERSPYYIRFWYSPFRKAWQPLQLKLVTSAGGSANLAANVPRILF